MDLSREKLMKIIEENYVATISIILSIMHASP
jgi:hypothetical protein